MNTPTRVNVDDRAERKSRRVLYPPCSSGYNDRSAMKSHVCHFKLPMLVVGLIKTFDQVEGSESRNSRFEVCPDTVRPGRVPEAAGGPGRPGVPAARFPDALDEGTVR